MDGTLTSGTADDLDWEFVDMEDEEEKEADDWTIMVDRTHYSRRHGDHNKKPRFYIRLQHLLH